MQSRLSASQEALATGSVEGKHPEAFMGVLPDPVAFMGVLTGQLRHAPLARVLNMLIKGVQGQPNSTRYHTCLIART